MVADIRDRVGRFGVWNQQASSVELVQALERLGYGTYWVGRSPDADLRFVEELLDATTAITIATGIVNVWASDSHEVARSFLRLQDRHPERFVLGIGIGHREVTTDYRSPFDTLSAYVDTLLEEGVPARSLVLGALGPRALRLAADRTAGAHPYFVSIEHTRSARELLGPGPLLAPEHKVVVDEDGDRARATARPVVAGYLGLANYRNNLRRIGWSDADLSDGGSDTLVDALVAHGSAAGVATQLTALLGAGADHVAVQLFTRPDQDRVETFAELAAALGLIRQQ